MGRNQRIAFGVLAVVVAIVAVILIGGDDKGTDGSGSKPASAAAPTATATAGAPESGGSPTSTSTPTPSATPKPKATLVRYRGGEPVGGLKRLEYEKGETVRFAIASDVADEIHVHGYDIEREVSAGGRAAFSFKADIEGVFEVEMHSSDVQVAELRVEP